MPDNQDIETNKVSGILQEAFFEQIQDILVSRIEDLKDTLEVFQTELNNFKNEKNSADIQYSQVFEETLPDIFRKSHYVMIFATFESSLFTVCDQLEKTHKFKLTVADLRGKGIEQCKNYLEKVVGLKIDKDNWKKMTLYRDIRNYIIHSESRLWTHNNEKTNKLLKEISKIKNISIEETKNLKLSDNFLKCFLLKILNFLLNIFNEIKISSNIEKE